MICKNCRKKLYPSINTSNKDFKWATNKIGTRDVCHKAKIKDNFNDYHIAVSEFSEYSKLML